ncbi:Class II flagellar assembly regulator [Limimonas halophila]|uniref:Class II flagellar assembly regulator n=1 Tax=Limimonas halophila TaxID=1082479 RepID=A0A1G7Q5E4_9PROT|nr:flagellar assembly protein FliX [Limimonas halophila]SDF93736.1 Class II flagellar assembly regulator [Limimonas halophila]
MRIDRNQPHTQPTAPRGGQKSSGGNFAKALDSGGASEGGEVNGGAPVAGMDALLALQDVGEEDEHEQAKQHGERLLQRLEELKMDLLDGRMSADTVEQLAGEVDRARAETDDPRLNAILDEIELRASVELAKLGRL